MLNNINKLGCGISYRRQISKNIFHFKNEIDFIEIISDNFIYNPVMLKELKLLVDNFVIIPHGINLSIGSPSIDRAYLSKVKKICGITNCPYYSDHLSITKYPGISLGNLSPIGYTENTLKTVINNVNIVQDYLELPLILENITYTFDIPNNTLMQEEFISRLVEATKCGILIDVTNLHINSYNFGFDPFSFINRLPHNSVVQAHISGGSLEESGELIDTHDQTVDEMSWNLLKYINNMTSLKGVILERDGNFTENFENLLAQINLAKKYLIT